MKKTNDAVDVVVVGLGWTGAIMSMELAKAGLRVRALERGADRPSSDWAYPYAADELANTKRHVLMQQPSQDAFTVRHNAGETALPMRELGAFRLGDGVGGAGLHWTGQLIRPSPTDLKLKSFTDQHYAKGQLDEELRIYDYPVSWDDLEPHFDFFDKVCGTSGATGNLKGKILAGGDPFEGPRSNPFPTKALEDTLQSAMFRKAATELGYHPFSNPSAAVTEPWTNPYRQQIAPCNYCGFCQFYSCINYSKSSPQTTIIDALKLQPDFDYKTHAHVIRVEKHTDGKTATGVTYIDSDGNEVFQPAKIVILASFALNNVRLLLNSKIGTPYNPITEEGTVGRNYAYQYGGGFTLFYDKLEFNPFATAGPTGVMFNDFGPGNFDASQLGFIGGAKVHSSQATGTPMATSLKKGTPKWGNGWKKGLKESYGHSMAMKMTVSNMSTRGNFLDLDPNYTDQYGMPLLRMTYDFVHNDVKLMRFLREKMLGIVQHLQPDSYTESTPDFNSHFNISPAYSSTHNTGGAVMGNDPSTSVVNRYLQSWDVHNVFVQGACAFPQNFQANPTALVGALAYWSAKAIREQYIQQPGPLVKL